MKFQLYVNVGDNRLIEDPYCALSMDGSRLLMISDDMIRFDVPSENFENDALHDAYVPTSRYIEYDMHILDEMIIAYTSQDRFGFAAHFDEEIRHVGLTFARPPEWNNWHEYIDANHPDMIARAIVEEVFTDMEQLLTEVFEWV